MMIASQPALAQSTRQPLLQEGKDRLFQRVLVREVVRAGSAEGQADGEFLKPLQALYVYGRSDEWLEVGLEDEGEDIFWVPERVTVPWHQTIVATFERDAGLDRLLMFSDWDPIYDVIESEAPGVDAERLRLAAESGDRPEEIVALGPETIIDQREQLYVMPIIEAEEAIFDDGNFVTLLEVAVANSNPTPQQITPEIEEDDAASEDTENQSIEDYRAGVVFVVDTTLSMQPYIDQTRVALSQFFDEIEETEIQDAVGFGLIGFRDNLEGSPGLDYDVQTFTPLSLTASPQAFLRGLSAMEDANASSRNFREDSYAGITHAISELDWTGFDERWIVLVTDASPREAGDPLSATGLSGEGLRNLAAERLGAQLAAFHLRTSAGESDHAAAEIAYREITRGSGDTSLYFAIDDGNPELYGTSTRELARIILTQANRFRARNLDEGTPSVPQDPSPQSDLEAAILQAGQTMRLAYLGRIQGDRAPDVFRAYVADRDFDNPLLPTLSIRLLISKNQLSDLQQALKIIVEQAEANIITPDDFFRQVLTASAAMTRDPEEVALETDYSLADAALISEYLEGLPYTSDIMRITADDWVRMSIGEQQRILNQLQDKIERYEQYNRSTDLWVDYLGTGGDGQSLLYPLLLDDLP